IHETPDAAANALRGRITSDGQITFNEFDVSEKDLAAYQQVRLLGMGTSLHAAMIGEYLVEDWAGIPVKAEDASENRYRRPTFGSDTLVAALTQSGETADTLVALKQARERGALTVAITNVIASSAARDSDGAIYLHSGPEISVASTKTLIAHIVSLCLLSAKLAGAHRRLSPERRREIADGLRQVPDGIRRVLAGEGRIHELARRYSGFADFM